MRSSKIDVLGIGVEPWGFHIPYGTNIQTLLLEDCRRLEFAAAWQAANAKLASGGRR